MYTDKGIQIFSYYLRILKYITAPFLEWTLHNPPTPHNFTNYCLMSSSRGPENPGDYLTSAGQKGLHRRWRNEVPANDYQQRLMHVEQDIDFYKDKWVSESWNRNHIDTIISNLEHEKLNIIAARNAAILAEQQRAQISQINSNNSSVSQQNQSSLIERETTQRLPADVTPKKISINDLLNKTDTKQQGGTRGPNNESSSLIPFIAINGFPSIRVMLTKLIPWFKTIIGLFLPALFFMDIHYITDIMNFLSSVLGGNVIVNALILCLIFFFKLIFMIRRAIKSAEMYDRLFTFVANHYKSGLLYFIIFLISVLLLCFSAYFWNSV